MDSETKMLLAGAGAAAGAKLGMEAVWEYNAPKLIEVFPYMGLSTDRSNPAILVPPGDVWISCLGVPLATELLSRVKRRSPRLHAAAKGAALYGIPEFLNVLVQRGMWFAHAKGVFGPPGIGQYEGEGTILPQSPSPFNVDAGFPSTNVIRQVPGTPIQPQQSVPASLPWQRNMEW